MGRQNIRNFEKVECGLETCKRTIFLGLSSARKIGNLWYHEEKDRPCAKLYEEQEGL